MPNVASGTDQTFDFLRGEGLGKFNKGKKNNPFEVFANGNIIVHSIAKQRNIM